MKIMIESIFKKIPITTLILSYFFVCGVLYLIGFWGIFDIDISNLISLSDIPKSFVFPFILSQGFFVVSLASNYLTTSNSLIKDEEQIPKPKTKNFWIRLLKALFSLDVLFSILIFIIGITYTNNKLNYLFWGTSSFLISYYLIIKFTRSALVKKYIDYYNIRFYLAHLLFLLPIACFSTGKIASLNIYNNYNVNYVKIIKSQDQISSCDSTKFKLVGFIGDKLVVSTLDNTKLCILNQSSFDRIIITKK